MKTTTYQPATARFLARYHILSSGKMKSALRANEGALKARAVKDHDPQNVPPAGRRITMEKRERPCRKFCKPCAAFTSFGFGKTQGSSKSKMQSWGSPRKLSPSRRRSIGSRRVSKPRSLSFCLVVDLAGVSHAPPRPDLARRQHHYARPWFKTSTSDLGPIWAHRGRW